MAFTRTVERQIEKAEGFAGVVIASKNGHAISRLRMSIPKYPWDSPAPDTWTIADWRRERFKPTYGSWDALIYVYDFSGRVLQVLDAMKLSFVRARSAIKNR